jgi:gas vesicle protein
VSRRTHKDVVFVERETSSPVWWLLAGGALGASLALLFAPEPGDKTRRMLARRLRRLRDSADQALEDFRGAVSEDSDIEDDLAPAADDEMEEVEDAEDVEDEEDVEEEPGGDGKLPSARAELEKRLAAVRARRQRVYADEDEEPVA